MYIFLTILIVIVAIFLIGIVLIQQSKGGGLASNFAGANQVMGAPRTADLLEKASWTFIAIIVVLSILAVGIHKGQIAVAGESSAITEHVEEAASQLPQTSVPAQAATEATEAESAE